jgi:hypothetical protein
MAFRKYWIVQLCFDCWLAPWDGDPGRTTLLENAQRFKSRKMAEQALAKAREYREFPDAFVDELRATVI